MLAEPFRLPGMRQVVRHSGLLLTQAHGAIHIFGSFLLFFSFSFWSALSLSLCGARICSHRLSRVPCLDVRLFSFSPAIRSSGNVTVSRQRSLFFFLRVFLYTPFGLAFLGHHDIW